MADYACSLYSLSTLLTRTLRRCLALQICAILSHSRYTTTYFTSFFKAPVASFNNLSMLSAHYLSVSYGMPSQPIHCTSESVDCLHLLADEIWTFRVPGGNSSIVEFVLLCTWIYSNLGDNCVRYSSRSPCYIPCILGFFFSHSTIRIR